MAENHQEKTTLAIVLGGSTPKNKTHSHRLIGIASGPCVNPCFFRIAPGILFRPNVGKAPLSVTTDLDSVSQREQCNKPSTHSSGHRTKHRSTETNQKKQKKKKTLPGRTLHSGCKSPRVASGEHPILAKVSHFKVHGLKFHWPRS